MPMANNRAGRASVRASLPPAFNPEFELVRRGEAISWIQPRSVRPTEHKFAGVHVERVEADGSFSGYAAIFGAVDLAKDVIERNAFRKSLAARGAAHVRMLYQHDANQPIGTWTEIREDGRGLFVRGRLTPDVTCAREVLALMRSGALDGLSIGFRTVRARKDADTGVRRILEADLWEISVVTFPMQPQARVENVKATPLVDQIRAAGRLMRQSSRQY